MESYTFGRQWKHIVIKVTALSKEQAYTQACTLMAHYHCFFLHTGMVVVCVVSRAECQADWLWAMMTAGLMVVRMLTVCLLHI